jgi:hypothetical protein
MTDEIAPYSKAIEETAKTTGKAIDAVREGAHAISRPVANIYGLLIGDHIDAARERNLDALSRKTKKILKDRDLEETAPVSEQIAIPLLEAARGESREELQDIWAQLLANAMDPARRDDVRPAFINTLRKLEPIDALTLDAISQLPRQESWTTKEKVAAAMGARRELTEISIDSLYQAGCLYQNQRMYALSAYGREFLRACSATVSD